MVRDFGVVDGVVGLPPAVLAVLTAVTAFGNAVVIAGGLLVLYFRGPLPTARVEAVGLLWLFGWGLRTILKYGLQWPRPPVEPAALDDLGFLATLFVDAHGFGFPSGHAANATLVLGGLAWASGHRRAYPAAAVGIGVVALSRVGLGVHYVGDVIGGIGLGGLILAGGVWLYRRLDRLFVPTLLVGIVSAAFFSVFLTNYTPRSLAYAVVALAAWVGWRGSDRRAHLQG